MRAFFAIPPQFVIGFALITCSYWAVCASFASETRSNWATDAYKRNCVSVVFIQGDKVEDSRGRTADAETTFNGMGTGIIIDERGYIITNYHVVKDLRRIQVKTFDGKEYKDYVAELVAKDADTDLAIIKIAARASLQPIAFGRSHDLMVGESCIAIGNPYGYSFSLTDGRISGIGREVPVNDTSLVYRVSIQTNTEINPGNSGGPLINVEGKMIGINVAIRQGAAGIAFATPVDQVVEVAAKLIGEIANQKVSHGLTISQHEPSDYNTAKRFILRVESVENNSPAARAGIQKGDILTGIGKDNLINKLDFYRALLDLKANEDVAFTVFRNKEFRDIIVTIGALARGGVMVANRTVTPPPSPSPQPAVAAPRTANNVVPNSARAAREAELDKQVWDNLGILYTPIPQQEFERSYKKFLPQIDINGNVIKPGFEGGIIVKAVREGSPADRGNLYPGDIITSIGPPGVLPWEMYSAGDIRYVGAQEWTKIQSENQILKANVIRDNDRNWTPIPMQ